MNALNQALLARGGQDTNRQLRAHRRESGTDSRTGFTSGQSFDPAAAAMNALNFQTAGLAPTASPMTGQAAPWAQTAGELGNAGLEAALGGLIPGTPGYGGNRPNVGLAPVVSGGQAYY
jgi:hypothetical protein